MKTRALNACLRRLCAITLVLGSAAVAAQDYPNRPVRIVVGYPAGGGPDIIARMLGQGLSQALNQPFVIDNKPGAGGTLSTGFVAKSPPDGYTLLLGETGQLVIAPFAYKSLPYDTLKDLAPIGLAVSSAAVLVSSRKTQPEIHNMEELIRYAKARPGKLDYGSPGVGTMHHILMEALKSALGLRITHIPYRGVAVSVPAVLSGEVPLIVTSLGTLRQNVAGVHVLAITSKTRSPAAPDVPALGEYVKDFEFISESGLLAPAGTPADIISKISTTMKTVMQSPEFTERVKTLNFYVTWLSPEAYAENIRQNTKRYANATKIAGIQPE